MFSPIQHFKKIIGSYKVKWHQCLFIYTKLLPPSMLPILLIAFTKHILHLLSSYKSRKRNASLSPIALSVFFLSSIFSLKQQRPELLVREKKVRSCQGNCVNDSDAISKKGKVVAEQESGWWRLLWSHNHGLPDTIREENKKRTLRRHDADKVLISVNLRPMRWRVF